MTEPDNKKAAAIGRRDFIRSIFGLGGVAESQESASAAETKNPSSRQIGPQTKFIWADLANGQMGFPTGQSIPSAMPGSVMKIVSAAALADARFVDPDEKIECRGSYKHKTGSYNCLYAHGMVDLVNALGLSCNVYFARQVQKMPLRALLDYASCFGLDQNVEEFGGGKFPLEFEGKDIVPYALGLSEDLEPSALQILRMAALVGTTGNLPYLHSAERPDKNALPFKLELKGSTFQILKQGMKIAGRSGTAKNLDPENKLKLAVKTGTTPHGSSFQSWICGYFPFDAPRYAFVLRSAAGSSQDAAVPQARKFLFAAPWP